MKYIKDSVIKSGYQLRKELNVSFPPDSPPDGWQIYTPPEPTLDEIKQRKKNEINALKTEKQNAGFEYDGMVFDCDEVSIARIHATWSFAQSDPNYTQPFVLQDNTTVTLTNAQCLGLGAACGQFVSNLTLTARQLKNDVLAVKVEQGEKDETAAIERVNAITWS